jgi:cytochrome c
MMAASMGMGDLVTAMNHMDEMQARRADEASRHVATTEQQAGERGKALFHDPATGGGRNGLSCNSCHPGGGSTGGEAAIAMRDYKIPIPSLQGAGATYPKYKIPNGRVISLGQMNNNCVRMFMAGEGLAIPSADAAALEAYVMSFSNGEDYQSVGANAR